ncbi:ureidoglycolate lyase [Thioclava sp. GXIMD2076]|uniref:Ureidoglycolate lyase n=1 Tax=Thioclava kandeliae TaxID=3070818 RepID=A0ABV1SJX6_9RHOB
MSLPASLPSLTEEAFAPYGKVIRHKGQERRAYFSSDIGDDVTGTSVTSWVSRIAAPLAEDMALTSFERHPHTDQLFVPLSGQRFLVVVCDDANGKPAADTARAFMAEPGTGVLFHRNIWHAGMQTFDAPAEFVVMMRKGLPDDDVFVDLDAPLPLATIASCATERAL